MELKLHLGGLRDGLEGQNMDNGSGDFYEPGLEAAYILSPT